MAKVTRTVKKQAKPHVTEVVSTPRVSRTITINPLIWQKLLPVVYVALLIGSFMLGVLWQRVENLRSGVTNTTATTTGTQQAAAATDVPVSVDQIKSLFKQDLIKFGNENSKVLFVEVGDPSCPYCHIATGKNSEIAKQAGPRFTLVADGGTYVAPVVEMKKLVDAGKASFLYIYTPGHGSGEMGQKALYCAFEKGKFWPVHDKLYTNAGYTLLNDTVKNDKTKSQLLADFLKDTMNANDLKSCLDSGKYDARLTSDTQLAGTLGVTGTPGFFVNGTRYAGAYSYTDMEQTVTAALK
jgi:protein-disulfide isomerase